MSVKSHTRRNSDAEVLSSDERRSSQMSKEVRIDELDGDRESSTSEHNRPEVYLETDVLTGTESPPSERSGCCGARNFCSRLCSHEGYLMLILLLSICGCILPVAIISILARFNFFSLSSEHIMLPWMQALTTLGCVLSILALSFYVYVYKRDGGPSRNNSHTEGSTGSREGVVR